MMKQSLGFGNARTDNAPPPPPSKIWSQVVGGSQDDKPEASNDVVSPMSGVAVVSASFIEFAGR